MEMLRLDHLREMDSVRQKHREEVGALAQTQSLSLRAESRSEQGRALFLSGVCSQAAAAEVTAAGARAPAGRPRCPAGEPPPPL